MWRLNRSCAGKERAEIEGTSSPRNGLRATYSGPYKFVGSFNCSLDKSAEFWRTPIYLLKAALDNCVATRRHISLFILLVSLPGLSSCVWHTTYPLIKPTAPKVSFLSTAKVDSLQPVFKWSPSKIVAKDVQYDLIVYEAIYNGDLAKEKFSPGPVVYYREGLADTEHRMEQPLRVNVVVGRSYNGTFIWSVRTRQGTQVSKWAGYDRRFSSVGPGMTGSEKTKDQPFLFSAWNVAPKRK